MYNPYVTGLAKSYWLFVTFLAADNKDFFVGIIFQHLDAIKRLDNLKHVKVRNIFNISL